MTLIKLQYKDSEDSFRVNPDYIVMFKKAYKGTRLTINLGGESKTLNINQTVDEIEELIAQANK